MHYFARIRTNLATDDQAPAIEEGRRWYSRAQVAAVCDALTGLLDQAGLGPGTRIGLVARNRMSHIAALFGLLASGRTTVMLYSAMTPDALAKEIEKLRLPVLIADAQDWTEVTLAATARVGTLALQPTKDPAAPMIVVAPGDPAKAAGTDAPDPDIAIEMLSSGTTGAPKRIPISWRTLEAMARDAAINFPETGQGMIDGRMAPLVQPAPLANIGGLYAVIPAGVEGWPLALVEKFGVEEWLETVKRVRPRVSWLAPASIRALWDADVPAEDLASLAAIRTGSAPISAELKRAFERKYGLAILLAYGATEFCGVVVLWTLADHTRFGESRQGSAGRARPGVALRVRDTDGGAIVPAGTPGLLELKVDRIGPDWIVTTDLASLDNDGFLYLLGRADDAINRGGFKVMPATITDALCLHPEVADAAVIGLADDRLGQIPAAAIELREGAGLDEQALREFLRGHLLAYQIPARFMFVPRLPRNQSLKVDRAALRALFEADATIDAVR